MLMQIKPTIIEMNKIKDTDKLVQALQKSL